MKKLALIIFISVIALGACKSKKELAEKKDSKIEEKATEKVTEDVESEAYLKKQEKLQDSEGEILAKKALAKLSDSLVARIQRTACFGRCPIYTASIYKSGYVDYMGEKWVQREGHFKSKISQQAIDKLLNEAKRIGFMGLENAYDSEYITDLPSTILSLRIEDQAKIVVNRYQAPEKLRAFEQYFDKVLEGLTYEPVSLD